MTDYLSIAIEAARQAGELQREGMTKPIVVREAARYDVKLQTDVDCEARIRDIILNAFPDHAILGEEGGGSIPPETPTWIVDPLDGTVNFSHRIPHFCTSIALEMAGRPVVGVIYNPMLDEMFTAEEGQGAYLNGKRIQVSGVNRMDGAAIAMGFSKSVETITRMLHEMHSLIHTVQKFRIFGAAALDMAFVASGRLDGFLEYGLRSWDIAAGTLLVREAGGRADLTPAGEFAWHVRADNNLLSWK